MKRFMRRHLDDVLIVSGASLIVTGLALISTVAALIAAGVFLIAFGVLTGLVASKKGMKE